MKSFHQYIEDIATPLGVVNTPMPISIPPEGIALGGPNIKRSIISSKPRVFSGSIYDVQSHNGINFIILNETLLKDTLLRNQLIIKNGYIFYDKVNKVIDFDVEDLMGKISIDQLMYAEKTVQSFDFVLKTTVNPTTGKVTIYLNPNYELGGV